MIRVIIVDDEHLAIENLQIILNSIDKNIEIVSTASNVVSAVHEINKHNPDLVFLDIKMPTGSGFDVLEKVKEVNFKFVFVTAFDEYALKALKNQAFDYLIKPVSKSDLALTIQNFKRKFHSEDVHSMNPDQLVVRLAGSIEIIKIKDIEFLKAESNYTTIHLFDSSKIVLSKTLKSLESSLDPNVFLRCHHSYIVNKNYIQKFISKDGGFVILASNSEIPVSVRKKNILFKKLNFN
jgi:two-component system LytT family response regulator